MDRERLEDLVSDYLDGDLAAPGQADLVAELRTNPDALRYLLAASGTSLGLAVRRAPAKRKRRAGVPAPSRLRWLPWAAAAALLVTVAGLALVAGRRTDRRDPAPSAPRIQAQAPPPPAVRADDAPRTPPVRIEADTVPPATPAASELEPIPKTGAVPAPPAPPKPEEPPAGPRVVEPSVAPPPAAPPTRSVAARIARVDGEAGVVAQGVRKAAAAGQDLGPDDRVETASGSLELRFADDSRLDVEAGSLVRDFRADGGRRLHVERGSIRAEIRPQPRNQPFVVATPHGEARVLGTTFRLFVDADPRRGTRLEVEEGRVQLRNLEKKTATVEGGHFAVAAAGLDPVSRRLTTLLVDPGFEGGGKGWQTLGEPGRLAVVKAGRIRSGSRALQLVQIPQSKCAIYQDVPVEAGTSYDVAGWAWSERASGPFLKLSWWGADGKEVAPYNLIPAPDRAQAWARYAGRFPAPLKAVRLRLSISASDSDDSAGTAWFDDVELRPVER